MFYPPHGCLQDHAGMESLPPLLTVKELKELLGAERVGREALYAFARKFGVRFGKRYLIPRQVVLALVEGRLEELEKTPGVEARGR
ncbi:helix-turn-helix domain-containing protein [Thermus scotoductus]|nr:helix-turn-helix domain-containing protein [Thermus scotoductus]